MKWLGKLIYLVVILISSGCVAGQSIEMVYVPDTEAVETLGIHVRVSSEDQREFILNGKKMSNYMGRYRGGFGKPFDVTTKNKQPLASNLHRDVTRDLIALGFDVVDKGAGRILKVEIKDWDFNTYINGKMWYQIHVVVEAADGEVLVESDFKDKVVIKGNEWVGAKYAFERELPKIYKSIVNKVARDNPQILSALKSG